MCQTVAVLGYISVQQEYLSPLPSKTDFFLSSRLSQLHTVDV